MRRASIALWIWAAGCGGGAVPGDGGPVSDMETGRMVGMTAAHNAVRARVSGSIPPLVWSGELARTAQAWSQGLAAQCRLMHSSNGYGENIAQFGGSASPQDVVDLWVSEEACYTFGPFMAGDSCTGSCGACGHYTQVVWAGSQRLGCGVADCAGGGTVWTCNYDPPGNFIGQTPY